MTIRERVHALLESLATRVYDHAWRTIALVLAGVAALATQLPNIEFETRIEAFLHEDAPLRVEYDAFRREFGRDDLVMITLEAPDVFAPGFLERLRTLHDELDAGVPYVEEITSLVNARETRGEGDELIVGELLEDSPETPEELADVRERAGNRLYRNLLISADAGVTVVLIELSHSTSSNDLDALLEEFDDPAADSAVEEETGLSGEQNAEVVDAVRAIVAKHESPDFRIHVAGTASFAQYLQESMRRDMSRFTLAGILVIAVFLAFLFRSAAAVALPLVVVILSLVSVAIMAIVGIPVSMLTQILPSFLLAVGVGGSVHLLAIFFQRRRIGEEKRDAIIHAVGHSGLAIIMTSLTTAGAMASFATGALAPIAGLGICAPGGVMVALILTLVLLPALIAVFPVRGGDNVASGRSVTQRALVRCGDFALDHRPAVLWVSAAVLFAAMAGARLLEFSHAPIEWFPKESAFRVATELTDDRLGGSVNLEVLVDTGRENGMQDPALLRRVSEAQARVMDFELGGIEIGKSLSLADTVQEIHQALNENRPEYYAIPEDRRLLAQELLLFENSGSDDLEDVVDPRFQVGRITLRAPFGDAIAYVPFLEKVAADFEQGLPEGMSVRFTGMLPIMSGTLTEMTQSLTFTYAIAVIVIAVLLVILIGDLKLGLLAMIPNLTPIIIVLGGMGYFGVGLNTFTMLIGSIAIGLAVDDTIHFMHNFRRYLEETGDPRRAVASTLETTGQAMLFTTLVLSCGFAIFFFSSMSILVEFGLLTASAIILALAADVLLAPALMTWAVEDSR